MADDELPVYIRSIDPLQRIGRIGRVLPALGLPDWVMKFMKPKALRYDLILGNLVTKIFENFAMCNFCDRIDFLFVFV